MARASYEDWITEDGLARIEAWARDGLTDEQIAENIGCNRTTIYDWKNKHSDISNALKSGRAPVDLQVENALLKRALGYEYEETETIIEVSPDGDKKQRIKKIKKVALPDTGAAIFWLKNRKPDQWRRVSAEFKNKTEAETRKLEAEIGKLDLEKEALAVEMSLSEQADRVIIVNDLAEVADAESN